MVMSAQIMVGSKRKSCIETNNFFNLVFSGLCFLVHKLVTYKEQQLLLLFFGSFLVCDCM
jgi:hypothetical protein